MENKISEDEIRELEDEIDSAVDRLFRDKTGEFKSEVEKEPRIPEPPRVPAAAAPPVHPEPIERLETYLLQLEWDVTGENLLKTEEEVQTLRRVYKEQIPLFSVLGLMEKVIHRMIQDSEHIEPSLIRFLLDSKETIKLLLREGDGDIKTYQQLANDGLEARFALIEGGTKPQTQAPLPTAQKREEREPAPEKRDKVEEMFERIRASSERAEKILSRVEQTLLQLTEGSGKWAKEALLPESVPVPVTIFRANGKLFAVENEKVYKVFRIPEIFHERYSRAEKIRMKDVEVRMIDLRKIFSLEEGDERREGRILLVRDDGEYKGFRVEEVIKKLSAPLLQEGAGYEGYCAGTIQWRDKDHPVEIPVLDLKRF